MESTLRAMVAVRPEVLMLSSLPDQATATVSAQLASSLLVVAAVSAPSAARGLASVRELGDQVQEAIGMLSPKLRAILDDRYGDTVANRAVDDLIAEILDES